MNSLGENVSGYKEPVLNEREIRASAGIYFALLLIAFMIAVNGENFLMLKYFIIGFFVDFSIRVFLNPRYSPTLIIGRLIVNRQTPEYVSAAPKKFAWTIGLALSGIMFVHLIILNSLSYIMGIICMVCLTFLLFESAFGICLGCLFYPMIFKNRSIRCPGESCKIKIKEDICKTSFLQILIVLVFTGALFCVGYLFGDIFGIKPHVIVLY